MPGIADLLYLGQPDPARMLAQQLSGQQPQPPGGPGAGPQGPNPQAPNGPAPNQNPSPGDPAPPNAAPTPTAYQSTPQMNASYNQLANPPNLMNLYLQLQQRQAASDQINKGFALIAANHAGNPAMARAIMDSVSGGGGASGMVGDLMSLYNAQTQMAGQQQMLANADDMDKRLNLPPGTARSMILAGRGSELVKALEPTEQQRNIAAEHDAFIKGGGSEEDWQKNYLPMIITGGIPGITPDMKSMGVARQQWLADPANKGRPMPGYLTDATKWGIYSKDLADAKGQFGGMNQALNGVVNDLSDASNNPALDEITGGVAATGLGWLKGLKPGSPEYNLHNKLEGLGNTLAGLAKRGGPKGVGQNLTLLGSNPGDFTNYGIGDFRENVIAPKMRIALEAQANAYGAAGRLADMPGYLKPYLDPMYQAGGDLDPGGGYKPFTVDKNLKQPNAKTLEAFKNDMEHYGPEHALKSLEAQGFDTSSLR